jgi:hypothetical protein
MLALNKCLDSFQSELRKKNCGLAIIYQPVEVELKELEPDEPFLDPPTDALLTGLKKTSLQVIDLVEPYSRKMKNNEPLLRKYYWPHDGHHTSAGYNLMAEEVAKQLQKLQLTPF